MEKIKFKKIKPEYFEAINVEFKLDTKEIIKQSKTFTGVHDPKFYERIRAELDHMFYKYNNKWITSHRQLLITSYECMTTIQFIIHNRILYCNVYSRSCDYKKAFKEDLGFICNYIKNMKEFKSLGKAELRYFICCLHYWEDEK